MDQRSTTYLLPDSLLALASKDAIRRRSLGVAIYDDVTAPLEAELREVLTFYVRRIVREFRMVDPDAGKLAHKALRNVFDSMSALALNDPYKEDEFNF